MLSRIGAALVAICCLVFSSCDINSPEYSAEVLMPLVKTNLNAEDLNELSELEFVQEVRLPDVTHIFLPSLPVPVFNAQGIGPLPLIDESNAYRRARLDTAEFELTVINYFPINIKAGTEVVITNSTNTDEVFRQLITEDIPAQGGTRTFIVRLSSTSPWIDNDLQLYLANFGSDGSGNQPADFVTYNNIQLIFKINVVRINEVEADQGKRYTLIDTIDFELYEDENTANLEQGKLTLFLSNGFPASYYFQTYFLDENKMVIDSLLPPTQIAAPQISAQGYVVPSSVQESRIVTFRTRESINQLRNRVRYMTLKARFEVPFPPALPATDPVRLRHEDQVPLQLVGDLVLEVNPD